MVDVGTERVMWGSTNVKAGSPLGAAARAGSDAARACASMRSSQRARGRPLVGVGKRRESVE
jgi:hypothetical protein